MPKPLLSRPLDIFYIVFFVVHLAWSLPFEGQPLYPKWMVPEWASQFLKNYIKDTNDPWMLGVWSLTDTPFEWVWTKVFMGWAMGVSVPAMIAGIYGLIKDDPMYYPVLIAYSSAAVLATTTTTVLTLAVPTKSQTSISPEMKVYAMPDDQKWIVAISNAAFLVPPALILVDMLTRTAKLVRKGISYEAEKKRA